MSMEGSGQSILIVDDEEALLTICANFLQRQGFSVATARTGPEALEKVKTRRFDLVLTDHIRLPPDGAPLVGEIKSQAPETDVIVMSGSASLEDSLTSFRNGACDYLPKPFDPKSLLSTIQGCLRKKVFPERWEQEKRILREELEAAYALLKRQERLQEGFLARVNHELRSPLGLILPSLELLQSSLQLGTHARTLLDYAVQGAQRLKDIIEDVLVFSSLSRPSQPVKGDRVCLSALLRQVVEERRKLWESRQQRVILDFEEPLPEISGDAQLLKKAFVHLFQNAIRFNKPGGFVEIRARRQWDHLLVMVKDSGEGMPLGEQEGISTPFYQASEYLTRTAAGLGLGLAIVRLTVQAHRGTVSVESRPGQGSAFIVSLPCPKLDGPQRKIELLGPMSPP